MHIHVRQLAEAQTTELRLRARGRPTLPLVPAYSRHSHKDVEATSTPIGDLISVLRDALLRTLHRERNAHGCLNGLLPEGSGGNDRRH